MKADLHVHTKYSPCSSSTVKEVLESAHMKGIDAIAVTDHNTIKGGLEAKKANRYKDLEIIVGCEKKCEYGELLIYNLKKEIQAKKFKDIVKDARRQGAFIFIAHPFDVIRITTKWKNFSPEIIKLVDGIEAANGRNIFNSRSKQFYTKFGLKGVAGSDSHFPEEIGGAYVEYNKELWKEIFNRTAGFESRTNIFGKLNYLFRSFITKYF